MNKQLSKISALVLLLGTTASAVAVAAKNVTTDAKLNGLKLAIVKNAPGSDEIIAGDYQLGLDKLASAKQDPISSYNQAMGMCVANIKLNDLSLADKACSFAVEQIDKVTGPSAQKLFLKSMAYSNRGIVRYLADDNVGALEDFTSALLVDNNTIVKNNLLTLKRISYGDNKGARYQTASVGE
ncbi:hypothetical protein DXX93_04540 [Thalassotalea euphylliae]|uniref:Tetratricopeptide repeat protein n=1 Tax=Thalassotalea euphylliae TaxID=1655234 RepID=A0A3E0TMX9_9GAMM|nr:hypothetical protein [Thalassotalea euphylliae]REL25904.1 hypothetical protein DXX93_04540 [Thalassotalea euphylliae]